MCVGTSSHNKIAHCFHLPGKESSSYKEVLFCHFSGKTCISVVPLSAMLWNRKSDRKRIVYRAFCLLAWWISWWTCLAFHSISLTLFIRYYFPRNKGFSSASQPSSSSTTVSKPWRGNNFIEKRAQKARIFLTSCMHPLQKCGLCSCYFSLSLILLVRTLTYCPWLWSGIRLVQRVFGWGCWLNPKSVLEMEN